MTVSMSFRFPRVQCLPRGGPRTSRALHRCLAVLAAGFELLVLPCWMLAAGGVGNSTINSVAVSKPFFNPSQGQRIGFSFSVNAPGLVTVRILDRDGFLVRTLVSDQSITAGKVGFEWDGRDENGEIVPDEAYSLRIGLKTADSSAEYFPAQDPAEELTTESSYYDRRTGVFAYKLPKPARVHVQAGVTSPDADPGKRSGPVLKTLVNRGPRPAGPVIETWNGLDETGTFYVPDLRGFAMAVAATSLPENAMIATGNDTTTFLVKARSRIGTSMLAPVIAGHAHHRGLTALDDVSPSLLAVPSNATQSPDRHWKVAGRTLRGELRLEGPSADKFARQPGALVIFVDGKHVQTVSTPTSGMKFAVGVGELPPGDHIVAFDWGSEYGPVAVSALLVEIPGVRPASGKLGRAGQ